MKIILLCLCLCLIFHLTACDLSELFSTQENEVIASLGEKTSKEFYTSGGFQDFTDFGIYQYSDPKIEDNEYLKPMTEADIATFANYLEDFEGWVELHNHTEELYLHYAFDSSIIDTEDYFYLYTNPDYPTYGPNNVCGSYNIYFFDAQSETLYYFHNNI